MQSVDRSRRELLLDAENAGRFRDGQEPGLAAGSRKESANRTSPARRELIRGRIEVSDRVALRRIHRGQMRLVVDIEDRGVGTQPVVQAVALVADLILDRMLAGNLLQLSGREGSRIEARRAEAGRR